MKNPNAKVRRNILIITSFLALAVVAVVAVLHTVIIPNNHYNHAVSLLNEGSIVEAYDAFTSLNGYKDSTEKAAAIYTPYQIEKIKAAQVGDYVTFGAYEQDNDPTNGKEAVEWLILDSKDGKVLVTSKYVLDHQTITPERIDADWGSSSLRTWLNQDFFNTAFSQEERAHIPLVELLFETYPHSYANSIFSDPTQDNVFLLSCFEVDTYFTTDEERQCKPTPYAVAQGVLASPYNGNAWWWLRVNHDGNTQTDIINNKGKLTSVSNDFEQLGVRPALWIDLAA